MATSYDVTWYWTRSSRQWSGATAGTREDIRKAGYVAHNGLRSIGPPEGPPSEAEMDAVEQANNPVRKRS